MSVSAKRLFWYLKSFISQLCRPAFHQLAERMTWRFCVLLILEALCILVSVFLLIFADLDPWSSFMGLMFFFLVMPLCALQIVSRLSPTWSESLTFKYLAIVGVVIAWFATMSGRSMVASLFHVAPGEFPNALAAASILASGQWVALGAAFTCVALEVITFIIAFSAKNRRSKWRSSPMVGMLAMILTFHVLYLGVVMFGKALSTSVQKLIVAQIAWESDLQIASEQCLNEEQRKQPGTWKVFPRSVGESETVIVRGAASLPEKAFWKFTVEEWELYSSFDMVQVECGIKEAPITVLRDVEIRQAAHEAHRKQTARYWGIAPIATIHVETATLPGPASD